jgi:hypothetical protein
MPIFAPNMQQKRYQQRILGIELDIMLFIVSFSFGFLAQ